MLDVFKKDAFNLVSLTSAMELLPYVPRRIGEMGLFTFKGITTTTAVFEFKDGKLSLLSTAARGSMPITNSGTNRRVKAFTVPHIPKNDTVLADEVQNVRAFGTEDDVAAVSDVVNEKLSAMKSEHEVTHEYHRVGAIQGIIKDGDGTTTLLDLFTEFGVAEPNVNFDFTAGVQDMKMKSLEVIRLMETALGNATYDHIHAFCSTGFFDAFISHATVASAFERFRDNQFARELEPQRRGFQYGDIIWEEYRGKIGTAEFIPANTCRFVPVGVRDIFHEIFAPADFMETVNTPGKRYYAKQEPLKFNKGVELHSQSNPLIICSRPSVLIKGTKV